MNYRVWSIRTAKNNLSELVDEAGKGQPQIITNHNTPVAVVLKIGSPEEVQELLELRKNIRRQKLLSSSFNLKEAARAEGVESLSVDRETGREVIFEEGLK